MDTFAPAESSLCRAFEALIDYAGLFPPAGLAMEPAVDEYLDARAGGYAWMLGRFIVPASRLDELVTILRRKNSPDPVALSVIVDSDPDPRRWFGSAQTMLAAIALIGSTVPQVAVEVLEVPLPPLATRRETYDASIGQFATMAGQAELRKLPLFIEIPRDDRWAAMLPPAMDALARARLGAKLRCGGLVESAFPSVGELTLFVGTAHENNVRFKATAGLHHPLRHRDAASGWVMHGFLNLLAAATFAGRVDPSLLEQIVAEEDPKAFAFRDGGFAWRDAFASASDLEAMRSARFAGYGSCSLTEPIAGLVGLSILDRPR